MTNTYTDYWIAKYEGKNLSTGAIDTFYASTFGYKTKSTDTPADTAFGSRMLEGISITRDISSGRRIGGASRSGYGSFRQDATDKGSGRPFDSLRTTHSFAGRNFYAYQVSDVDATFSALTPRVSARFEGEPMVGAMEAAWKLRDIKDLLDTEVQTPLYDGHETSVYLASSAYLYAASTPTEMDITGDFAVQIRVKPDALASGRLIGWNGGTAHPWHISLVNTGVIRMEYYHSGGTGANQDSTATYAAAVWQTISVRVSGNQVWFLVTDMEDRTSRPAWDGPYTLGASTRDAVAGATFAIGGTATNYVGYISEARVWDGDMLRVAGLDDWDRGMEQRVYTSPIPSDDSRGTTTLEGYWILAADANDSTANANHLTDSGSPAYKSEVIGGGVDLTGKNLPLGLGYVYRAEPILINPTKSILQVSCRSIQAITSVTQNGGTVLAYQHDAAWTDGGEGLKNAAPTLTAFVDATVTKGGYIVYLPKGLLRTASDVDDGGIRVNFQGDDEGGFVHEMHDVLERLVTDFGPLTAAEVDMTGLAATAYGTYSTGIYVKAGTNPTIASLIDLLLSPLGYWYPARGTGKLTAGVLAVPEATEDHAITNSHLSDNVDAIKPVALAPPLRGVSIGYERTWDTLRVDALADILASDTGELAASYTEQYRRVTIEEDSVALNYLNARDVEQIDTALVNRDDAFEAGTQYLDIKGNGTNGAWDFELVAEPDTMEVGEVALVTASDQGFDSGIYVLVTRFSESSRSFRGMGK